MNDSIKAVEAAFARENTPDVQVGDTVKVFVRVVETRINPKTKKPEEKVRLQMYQGVVIADRHGGINRSIVVRKISGGIGVERIFPLNSPTVDHIEIVKRAKVRRAKLYYLRERIGKHAKLKERPVSKKKSQPKAPQEPQTQAGSEQNASEAQQ